MTGILFPEQASTFASNVDNAFWFITWVSLFFFVLIVAFSVYFIIRYKRRSPDDETPRLTHNLALEIVWSVIPSILVVIMAVWGWVSYMNMRAAPANALTINVTAQKWSWSFTYPDGEDSLANEVVVPVNRAVKLVMSSQDVIHSFFVPAMRLKRDVLPNRYTTCWFEATKTGSYPIFCTEYCGTGHSGMTSVMRVVTAEEYATWLQDKGVAADTPLVKLGELLYKSKQCITCHSLDGSRKTGPSFKGIFGHEQLLTSGKSVIVDEEYIRESVMEPMAKVAAGFQPVMPTFKGQLKDKQIQALIEFIKSLSPDAAAH